MIREITLSNFRCFEGQDIEFSGLRTAIVGPNGAGKSSIQDALAYLVTGACRGTTVDGKGLDAVVRQGEETMAVRALVDGIGEVSRGIGRRMVSRGAQKGEYVAEPILERAGELLERFGGSRRIFDLAVRPDAWAALHGREQAEALMALGGIGELTLEALLAAGCPKTVSRYRQNLDGTLAGFLAAQQAAYADRLEAQRGAERARGAFETAQGEARAYDADQHAQDAHELAEVRERVGRLQREDDRAAAEHRGRKAELERRAANLQKRAGDLQAASKTVDVAALIAERADLAKEAESLRKMAGGKCASELAAEISLLRGRRKETADQVRGQVAGIRDQLKAAEASLESARTQLANYPEQGEEPPSIDDADDGRMEQLAELLSWAEDDDQIECPTCGADVDTAPLRAELDKLVSATEGSRHERAAWETRRDTRAAMATQITARTEQVDGLRSALEAAEQKLSMIVEAESLEAPLSAAKQADALGLRVAQLDADIAAAEADPKRRAQLMEARTEAKRAAADLEELGNYVPAHAEEIRQSTERLAALEAAVDEHERGHAEAKRVKRLEENWLGERNNADELNELVGTMQGPLREVLFGEAVRQLSEELAAAMAFVGILFGDGSETVLYGARVGLDERGRLDLVLLRELGGDHLEIPYECCSESERIRLGWALQAVAAQQTGLVVLDSPEALDDRFRAAVWDLGDALAEAGVQVIVCAVDRADRQPPAGWGVVHLDDGLVTANVRGSSELAPFETPLSAAPQGQTAEVAA